MPARSKARRRAFEMLYEGEAKAITPGQLLDQRIVDGYVVNNAYTTTLVRGVTEHAARIDAVLADYSQAWQLSRMPAVDRNLLRLGAYEVLYVDDVPDGVAISEAVDAATELSTDESPAFLNGVLSAISRDKSAILAV
ncbi:transcription antitermination factor NusB [Nocardioidaceae bacterium]|nr:transcription antitermination factor NusB [Nocardioidaceae bacterium]